MSDESLAAAAFLREQLEWVERFTDQAIRRRPVVIDCLYSGDGAAMKRVDAVPTGHLPRAEEYAAKYSGAKITEATLEMVRADLQALESEDRQHGERDIDRENAKAVLLRLISHLGAVLWKANHRG